MLFLILYRYPTLFQHFFTSMFMLKLKCCLTFSHHRRPTGHRRSLSNNFSISVATLATQRARGDLRALAIHVMRARPGRRGGYLYYIVLYKNMGFLYKNKNFVILVKINLFKKTDG